MNYLTLLDKERHGQEKAKSCEHEEEQYRPRRGQITCKPRALGHLPINHSTIVRMLVASVQYEVGGDSTYAEAYKLFVFIF